MHHRCGWSSPDCTEARLCERCAAFVLATAKRQARAQGQVYAEKHRTGTIADDVALDLVRQLVRDERLLDELARACQEGSAEWWRNRPERYR